MAEHNPTQLSHLIRRVRKKRNWRQQDVAERCGWKQHKVSKLETGVTSPDLDDLETIAQVFDVPIGRLLRLRKRAA